jgi:2-polyprenyl-3-methyl-5-hydroxy-6-metoxy-1,4-benzoquinol methylase
VTSPTTEAPPPVEAGPVEKVSVPCPHCGEDGGEVLWAGRDHEYDNTTDEEFGFVRCPTCGLVRLNPRPDVSELRRIYPPNYYAYNLLSDDPDGSLGFTDRTKKRMYQQRFAALTEHLGKQGAIRVLDVGCADGRLLDWYRDSSVGDRIETHGIEMDEKAAAAAQARGHRVITGRFEVDRELEPASFDLILAYHVIEHVDDPEGFARHAADLLAPNGLFVLTTPNWDSRDARRFRGHWGGNHFPRHWTLYDESTLAAMAEGVGLDVDRVEYQPNPIFWLWTCHSWARARFPNRRWPDRLFPPVEIFDPSPKSFALQSFFTVVDLVQRRLTGRTASIAVELRKPPAGQASAEATSLPSRTP